MKKYTNKNSNERISKKPNAFKMLHIYKENYYKLSKRLDRVNKQLKTYSKEYYSSNILHSEYSELIEERKRLKKSLKKIYDNFNNLKSKLIKFGCTLLAGVVLVSGSVGLGIHEYNKNLNENLSKAYETITPYESFDTDYSNLKIEDIKDSPDKTTQLALDNLKVKIAQSLNIEDPSTIKILDNSTYVTSGHTTNITIKIDGIVVGTYKDSSSIENGETFINSDNSISDEVVKVIRSISAAQKKGDKGSAKKALEDSNDLLGTQISLPNAITKLAEKQALNSQDDLEIE